jgi:hypothetical protein
MNKMVQFTTITAIAEQHFLAAILFVANFAILLLPDGH